MPLKWGSARTRKVKQSLIDRDGYCCWICSKEMNIREISIDHIIPTAKGGTSIQYNLKLAHRKCNSKRGAPKQYLCPFCEQKPCVWGDHFECKQRLAYSPILMRFNNDWNSWWGMHHNRRFKNYYKRIYI